MEPPLLSKSAILRELGISRKLFEAIERELSFATPMRRKMYDPADVRRFLNNMKKQPCTDRQLKTKKNREAIIRISQSTEFGLEEAVRQITNTKQTHTH